MAPKRPPQQNTVRRDRSDCSVRVPRETAHQQRSRRSTSRAVDIPAAPATWPTERDTSEDDVVRRATTVLFELLHTRQPARSTFSETFAEWLDQLPLNERENHRGTDAGPSRDVPPRPHTDAARPRRPCDDDLQRHEQQRPPRMTRDLGRRDGNPVGHHQAPPRAQGRPPRSHQKPGRRNREESGNVR